MLPGAPHMRLSQFCRYQQALRAASLLAIAPLAVLSAQPVQAKQSVYVRDVRIDSILLAFGVDSSRVRAAAVRAIRDAGRLASDTSGPALDIDVTVPRSLTGGMFDPRGYVRIEVGRNLVERGKARSVAWKGMVDLPELPTWREFGRQTLPEVVRAVNQYLLSGARGA
jgi:hypothetical protein